MTGEALKRLKILILICIDNLEVTSLANRTLGIVENLVEVVLALNSRFVHTTMKYSETPNISKLLTLLGLKNPWEMTLQSTWTLLAIATWVAIVLTPLEGIILAK